jgi:hypothetical protein
MVRIAIVASLFSGIACASLTAAPTTKPTIPELRIALVGRQQEISDHVESTQEYKTIMVEVAKARADAKRLKSTGAATADDQITALNAIGDANKRAQQLKADAIAQDVICRDLTAQIAEADLHPAPKAIPAPPIQTFLSMLAQLPKDARPDTGQWDEFSLPKARKFLNANAIGKQVSVTSAITNMSIMRITGTNQDETVGWKLIMTMGPERTRMGQADTYIFPASASTNGAWQGGHVELPVTEAQAKLAKAWRHDSVITFAGTIKQIEASSSNGGDGYGEFSVVLDPIEIKSLDTEEKKPQQPAQAEYHPTIPTGPIRVH